MEIKAITKFDEFLNLENTWDSVLEKSQSDDVCLTFEWFKAWWLGFGKNKQLFILLLMEKGNLIGIAPFMIKRARYRGFPVREISFIQNEHSPHSDFLFAERREDVLDTVIEYLKKEKNKWDLINLNNVPKDSPNYEILQKCLKRNGMLFGVKKGLHSPFIQIQSDWETYFSSRSTKFRKVLRNKINRMQRLGSYSIKKIEDITNNNEILTKISEISKNSWKVKHHKEITATKEDEIFFQELSRLSEQNGWLNIFLMTLNDKPIAYEYHLKYKKKEYALRGDFDEQYRENHPGSVLDAYIVQSLFGNGIEEYEMGGTSDLYKLNWTSQIREHVNFVIFRNSFYETMLYIFDFKIISYLKKLKFLMKIKEILKKVK